MVLEFEMSVLRIITRVEKTNKSQLFNCLLVVDDRWQVGFENGMKMTPIFNHHFYLKNANLTEHGTFFFSQWPELSSQYAGYSIKILKGLSQLKV